MTRPEMLEMTKKCVCGDREQDYGSPERNFETIAKLWTAFNGNDYTAHDVAIMLALLKVGRIASGNVKEDNYVDLAGYCACACEIATTPEEKELSDALVEIAVASYNTRAKKVNTNA